MDTIEYTFGLGCNLHKVIHAVLEQDEDVVLDENGDTESYWETILPERGVK